MVTAAGTASAAMRSTIPDPASEAELYSMMLSTAEALPEMVQREGAAWGIAQYKQAARTILQALTGCR
jgi:hypothetical protein